MFLVLLRWASEKTEESSVLVSTELRGLMSRKPWADGVECVYHESYTLSQVLGLLDTL